MVSPISARRASQGSPTTGRNHKWWDLNAVRCEHGDEKLGKLRAVHESPHKSIPSSLDRPPSFLQQKVRTSTSEEPALSPFVRTGQTPSPRLRKPFMDSPLLFVTIKLE